MSFAADTGTDFAWAWNAPLMQIGGRGGLLFTSGRCVGSTTVGLLAAWALHHYKPALMILGQQLWRVVLYFTLTASGLVYAMLTALIWPQKRLEVRSVDRDQDADAAAAQSEGSA